MKILKAELLEPVFFGCGPAPKCIDLLTYLKEHYSTTEMVSAKFIDRAADDWRHSIKIHLDYVAPTIWEKTLYDYKTAQLDLFNKNRVYLSCISALW